MDYELTGRIGPGEDSIMHAGGGPPRVMYLEPAEPSRDSEPAGLVESWQLIRSSLPSMVIAAVLGMICGAVLTLFQTPIYQTSTTIEVQGPAENSMARIGAGDGDGGAYPGETFLQTQVRIFQSHSLRQRVLAELAGPKRSFTAYQPDRLWAWRKALGLPPVPPVKKGISGVPKVDIKVKSFELTRIIEIQSESADPVFAADYANAMVEAYGQMNLESRWKSAQDTTTWLRTRLEELRSKLQASETALRDYSQKSNLLYTGGDKDTVEEEKLKQLQSELMRAQADRILKQAGYEVTNGNTPESVPQVISNERLAEQQTQLADLRRKLAELSTTMTPKHPKVRELQAQIAELDSALAKGRTDILTSLRIEYRAAAIRENLLRIGYEQQARTVQEQANHTVDYGLLKQDADTNRRLYEALLQKLSEFGVTSALRASNTRILDPAPVPQYPAKPDLLRNVAMGLVSGIMLGAVFVLGRYRFDRSIKAPGETAFHLKIPELGVIPTSNQNGRRYLPSGQIEIDKTPLGHERDCVELATWQNKTSIVAESFRNTLASLLSPRNGALNKPRVIVITSPGRGEGKSSTASNLGIALAEINQKVLLIDADMRKAGLHAIFDLPNSWGLSDLLRERNSLKDCPFEALARKTEIEGLYLLPAGPGTVSISNLLYSSRMRELLARLRTEFDTILIDTPPMLYVSDARVLGRLADSALLVIRAGQTTRDAAVTAKQRILDDGVPVLGTILNGWDLRTKNRYGYYGYYGYREPEA